jgi:hypothetical protein
VFYGKKNEKLEGGDVMSNAAQPAPPAPPAQPSSAVAAGLIALAVAVFMFGAMFLGFTKAPGCLPIMGFWLLGAFFVQFTVALIELKAGRYNAGNVFLFFSAFFCFTTGLEMIFKYIAIVHEWAPMYDGRVDGWSWIALGIALIPITICYFKSAPLSMNLMVMGLDFAVIFIIGIDLMIMDPAVYGIYAGIGCFWAGFWALYTVSGMFINQNWGRVVLPLGGPIIK